MKKDKLVVLITVACLILGQGCSKTQPKGYPVAYFPMLLHQGTGQVIVHPFRYQPAEFGKVKSNQISNTAPLGSLYLDEDISPLFTRALRLELKFAGYSLDKGDLELCGDILKFEADDFGYSVTWYLDITYRFSRKNEKDILLEIPTAVKEATYKFADPTTCINEVIAASIEQLFGSKEAQQILAQ